MAYMHKETFDICVENSCKNPNDYFYIDDLIALPIQILNRKGYYTVFCCSGHPFDHLEENNEYEESLKAEILAGNIVFPKRNFNAYILFKEGISLPTLPPGFICMEEIFKVRYNKLNITKSYKDNDDAYEYMRNVLEAMEQLYKWALNLPDFKD